MPDSEADMAQIIRMPEVLAGATEATVQKWLIASGEHVSVGQPLVEIETDKAVVEYQSESEGVVGRLLAEEGDNVAVGGPILVLVEEGEGATAIDAALAAERITASGGPEPAQEGADDPGIEPLPPSVLAADGTDSLPARRLFMSPLVRRLAAEKGVDVTALTGTGPNGRIVRRDLERHLEAAASTTEPRPVDSSPPRTVAPSAPSDDAPESGYTDIPLDRMRRAIARRLTESKSTVPHFYVVAHCRVDALLALRRQINATAARRVSVNDLVIKAVARAMAEVPEANAIWNGDSIRRFSSVDVAVAVATDGGLLTPVLRGVERLSLSEVSGEVVDLAERARSGRLRQHELEGGSFAVSNLGMYGTAEFSAILNPPQSGILAVGAAQPRAVVGDDGELEAASVMTVTLSADHRVLDGAVAASWLAAFQRCVENPLTILI